MPLPVATTRRLQLDPFDLTLLSVVIFHELCRHAWLLFWQIHLLQGLLAEHYIRAADGCLDASLLVTLHHGFALFHNLLGPSLHIL